nr:MAG TPA: hypothetical protein [Caudoviricetes sp.]
MQVGDKKLKANIFVCLNGKILRALPIVKKNGKIMRC